jgi:hypothetical protein
MRKNEKFTMLMERRQPINRNKCPMDQWVDTDMAASRVVCRVDPLVVVVVVVVVVEEDINIK